MSGSIVKLNASAHQAVQELLPWFVLGTLDSEEHAAVQEHVNTCPDCQHDIAFQRELIALQSADKEPAGVDAERAFSTLRARLRTQEKQVESGRFSRLVRNLAYDFRREWMKCALGAQLVAIVCLSLALLRPQQDFSYHGLGMGVKSEGNIVAVFKPQTSEQELRRILQASGARIVDGPTVADAYLLYVVPDRQLAALGALHAEPAVVMAESLESRSRR